MGTQVIPYSLSRWKDALCSTCELFTDKNTSFVPVGRIVRSGGMEAVRDYYHSLGEEYEKALHEMLVFDALIFNTDRHFGNFGFLVDSHTNRIVAPAPLFDHGNSLLNFAGRDDLQDRESIMKYAKTRLPCAYDDYVKEAKAVLTHEQRHFLRKLLNFCFKRHSRYNWDAKRLELTEYAVKQRAVELLDE